MTDLPSDVYVFANGIKLARQHLIPQQISRYDQFHLHEPVEEQWFKRLLDGLIHLNPVFLDVGAGIGYYSVLFKRLRPLGRVIAVDALPRHIARIATTLSLNGLHGTDVQLMQVAIGASNGTARFTDASFGSSLNENGTLNVSCRTLVDIIAEVGPVDLMKIDIQGSEKDVLESSQPLLKAGSINSMLVGTHSIAIHESLRTLLSANGYDILYDDPEPPMQPDGLIVAVVASSGSIS